MRLSSCNLTVVGVTQRSLKIPLVSVMINLYINKYVPTIVHNWKLSGANPIVHEWICDEVYMHMSGTPHPFV